MAKSDNRGCPACGQNWLEHEGLILTCQRLQQARLANIKDGVIKEILREENLRLKKNLGLQNLLIAVMKTNRRKK